jgi:hypothetical protein
VWIINGVSNELQRMFMAMVVAKFDVMRLALSGEAERNPKEVVPFPQELLWQCSEVQNNDSQSCRN